MRERERDTDRQTDRQTDRGADRQRERGEREREGERERGRERERDGRWDPRGAFEARDLGSLNGTLINGVRLSPERTPSGWAELKGLRSLPPLTPAPRECREKGREQARERLFTGALPSRLLSEGVSERVSVSEKREREGFWTARSSSQGEGEGE